MNDAQQSWFYEQVADDLEASVIHREAPAGAMAPLIARDEREVYLVVEGEITFFVGKEEISAGPGDVVVAPADALRTFRVESSDERARWFVLTRVQSLDPFIDFGRAVSRQSAWDWPSEDEHAQLQWLALANGIELLAPPGVLPSGQLVSA
jgi:quercetin dioxygenase-like cupin family protein